MMMSGFDDLDSDFTQDDILAPLCSELPPADLNLIQEIDIGVQNFLVKCISS
jgi:hypothetical protein